MVPAVALAGALVATPFIFHLGSSAPLSATGDVASAHRAAFGHRAARPGPAGRKAASRHHGHPAASGRSAAPTNAAAPSPSPKRASITCNGTSGLLPQNYGAIVTFLVAHGYTGLAAAGIAGNIYRESTGNPESVGTGGGGLIGWTPLPPGFVTGNPAADLQTQLNQLLVYNQQWAQFIPALNAATSARDAAFIYMSDFERPGVPAADIREGAAESVAAACHL